MSYLQPWMLWALPAILLPIIIHLLNRLRYRTVHWGAMMFLLKANKAATRRAKIRQYLLLLFRALVILFLIWAMARPITGGWIGSAAGGAPEVVLVLLDRSASMEGRGPDQQESKRQHAIALLAQAAKQSAGSRFVLIENVLRTPLEIADTATLGTMQMASATDTAADIPAMLRVALDYLVKNKPGSSEVWLASDMQSSNWRPDAPEWQDIAARFAGLPQETNMRILDLSSTGGANLSIGVKSAEFRVRDPKSGKGQSTLGLEIKSGGQLGTFPLLVTRDGAKSQMDLKLNAPTQRQTLKFDVPQLEPGGSWGKVELPADDAPADNTTYFVQRAPVPVHTTAIGDLPMTSKVLRFAAAPDPTRTDRTAEILPPARASSTRWKDVALVVWQGAPPTDADAKSLQQFVEGGGVLLALPPGGAGGEGPLGLSWAAAEKSGRDPFRVTAWDELDGPLSRTDAGASLPLARLAVQQRQLPRNAEGTAHVYGAFADGQPFLTGRRLGDGYVFACSTLPEADWSTLDDGFVILPMVQRLLTLGANRLAPPAMAVAGEWQPGGGDESWAPVETDRRRDPRWNAGVYKRRARLLALNRPETE
ncbi:MAG: BatA domain-containing protein, partial [Chthoniobacteraceae bacterium]